MFKKGITIAMSLVIKIVLILIIGGLLFLAIRRIGSYAL
jgi:hypothetical protein